MGRITDALAHAWNVFRGEPTSAQTRGAMYGDRPDRTRLSPVNAQTIVASIYTRLALDVASLTFVHARVDENGTYTDTIKSKMNNCFSVEANLDQSAHSFWIDVVISLLDEGVIAIVPVDTTLDPKVTGSYEIESMRVGKVVEWMPQHVRVRLYNEKTGQFEEVVVPKKIAAIIENPFYDVMNERNSTLQRLLKKISLLDYVDDQSASGKLDLIIQLPYVVKSPKQKELAANRKKDIETQLAGSKYGIAYVDATEHITQLNRPIENNLANSVMDLTNELYAQLGMTKSVFEGTASLQEMTNYYNQSITPIATAIVSELHRKFLTSTARTQGQAIIFMRDPFKMIPVDQIAEMADKLTRNEIMTSNELRGKIGLRPSSDPDADELRNKNLNKQESETPQGDEGTAGPQMSLDEFISTL